MGHHSFSHNFHFHGAVLSCWLGIVALYIVHLAEPLLEEAVPRNTLARLAREQICTALGMAE